MELWCSLLPSSPVNAEPREIPEKSRRHHPNELQTATAIVYLIRKRRILLSPPAAGLSCRTHDKHFLIIAPHIKPQLNID